MFKSIDYYKEKQIDSFYLWISLFYMVSLIQLEYIVALDTYRSFSVAAEKCFVTQPTLSMQIKKMETDLGVTIFDRNRQPVEPTEIGRQIIGQARVVLAESKKIDELVQESKGALTGDFRLGVIPSVAPYLLPRFLGDFARKYPGIKITVQEMLTHEILDALQTERIDAGILVTPVESPTMNFYPLYYERLMIYCNRNHKLAGQAEINLDQLSSDNLWLLSQGHCFRSQVINLCNYKDQSNSLPFKYESASIETLIHFVDKEGGFTLIPELAARDLNETKTNLAKPLKNMNPVREVSLVTNKVFVKNRILQVLKTEITHSVPAELLKKSRGEIVEWK